MIFLTDDGDDFEFSKMSNEVVTGRLQDIDGMAQLVHQRNNGDRDKHNKKRNIFLKEFVN